MTTPGRRGPAFSARGSSGPGSSTWHAERALLGALVRRPERIDHLSEWLQSRDFADPEHQGVFATVAGLHARGVLRPVPETAPVSGDVEIATQQAIARNVLALRDALATRRFTDVVYGSLPDLLPQLYRAGSGLHAAQYTRYGQMVLEMSARRQIEDWGVALERAAGPDMTTDNDVTALEVTQMSIVDNLARLDIRVRRSEGQAVGQLDGIVSAVPVAPVSSTLPHAMVERAERRVIHAVLSDDPQWRESGLLQRLRPEDFVASPAHRATWCAIQAVAASGVPIDPITVAWQAETAVEGDGTPGQPALSPAELATMREAPTGDVGRAISTVTRSALAHHARHARQEIQAATDRGNDVATAITAAQETAGLLGEHAERLATTTRASSPLTRRLAGENTAVAPALPPSLRRARTR
jgi:hypothetical protein